MNIDLRLGDCLEVLKSVQDNSIDSIVTDPPYELGFMGKKWDSTGIANNVELWKQCLRVLRPGGHLLAFSGTRTYHRMASSIEDAGFEVRDMIEWVYGSGFPKSLNIGKAVDKLQGNEREEVADNPNHRRLQETGTMVGEPHTGSGKITKGTSEWEGWGTALKPAHEPICMARKPLAEKTVAENVLKWGTGGINIDESRVETNEETRRARGGWQDNGYVGGEYDNEKYNAFKSRENNGRFPANLIHDNSEEVRECFPNESERFFKSIIYQAKASKSERNKGCEGLEEKISKFGNQKNGEDIGNNSVNDKFTTQPAKNNHPTVKPVALMEYLIKMVTPKGGVVFDPFMGSGSTGIACKKNNFSFIGIEMEAEYLEIAKARIDSL